MLSDVFVPLLTYPDPTREDYVQSLQDFISKFASEVVYVAAEIDLPNVADRWGASLVALPQLIAKIEASNRETAKRLVGQTCTEISGLAATRETLRTMLGQAAWAFVARARYHDLSITGIAAGSSEKISLAEQLIFGTGRPTMVVPEVDLADFDIRNMAIAWDGGLNAGRAVFDAMPLLKNARSVTVLTVTSQASMEHNPLVPTCSYLERHGIAPNPVVLKGEEPNAGTLLQDEAVGLGAGCLVMGAYGHSRLREFVLGGVSRTVLSAPKLPVFFSH
jgi:nucleotide-binding universal stress UspA family protein